MTSTSRLALLIEEWSTREENGDIGDLDASYSFMVDHYWSRYEPSLNAEDSFRVRLERWIFSVYTPEDRLALFRSLQQVQYFSREEIEALCQAAFNEHVVPWLVAREHIRLDAWDAPESLRVAVGQCWFCPVTDSMPISSFCHLNGLTGRDHRPDWRSIAEFADLARMNAYIKKHNIRRLVLLEDFVGSGDQFADAIKFADRLDTSVEILAIPLIVCPKGDARLTTLANQSSRVFVSPVLRLNALDFVARNPAANERTELSSIRALANSTEFAVKGDQRTYRGAFGHKDTGALVVMHSNAPDNTLPLFQRSTDIWHPPFPRSSRL